jgi:hypothetical protein
LTTVAEILGETAGIARVISPLDLLPVVPSFDRTLDPPAGHEVYGLPQVRHIVLVRDFADIPLPVLYDVMAALMFQDFFFKLGAEPEVYAQVGGRLLRLVARDSQAIFEEGKPVGAGGKAWVAGGLQGPSSNRLFRAGTGVVRSRLLIYTIALSTPI